MKKRPLLPTHCEATGVAFPTKLAPLHVVQGPDGNWFADAKGRWPGKGVWLYPEANAVHAFAQQHALVASQVEALLHHIRQSLAEEALGWLPLIAKAGLLVSGFEKVQSALKGGELYALMHASDCAPDGVRKLAYPFPDLPRMRYFTSLALGSVLGRGGVVHLGLRFGGTSQSFLRSCQRLAGFPEIVEV